MSFYNQYNSGGGGNFQSQKPEDDDKKLFVGGLSWETSKDDLKAYFETFGEVSYCALKTDPHTGKSRGFGFITFADEASVLKVVMERTHELGERNIDPKRAKSRTAPDYGPVKKIFVGGLDPNTEETIIRDYFGKFGSIVEFSQPFDKKKNQKKGFCFISFDKPDTVHNIVGNQQSSRHTLGSGEVEVKKALEQQQHGYSEGTWGQQGYGGYQQSGWGGQGARAARGSDRYEGRQGWGGEQGSYGGYGGGSYGAQSTYDNYGGQQSYGYSGGQNYGYGNGYE